MLLRLFSRMPTRPLTVLLLALACFVVSCRADEGGGEGLLAGMKPRRAQGVRDTDRITDGRVPPVGSGWNTNRTALFSSRAAFVEYDLGSEKKIEAAALLGDNNDRYVVLGSLDGQNFEPIFEARPSRAVGVRWREERNLGKRARYVRLTAPSGDASLSVAELGLFESVPATLPPRYREMSALDSGLHYRNALLVLAAALFVAIAGLTTAAPWAWSIGLLGIVAWGLFGFGRAFVDGFPLGQLEVSLTRGVAAVIALAVVARETWGPKRFPPIGWFQVSALVFAAACSVGSFFNLGHPQFYDQKNGEPSVVHNYDMRVYFPVAKYFHELKYDGLYLASVGTYAEENGGLTAPDVQAAELRDLRTHRMRPVREVHSEIAAIKARFTPERWAELKKDMRYFWETMGPRAYLGSMADHGGNATPVWLTLAYVMFKNAPASNEVLFWSGLLDPLLLLGFAVAVWRTFGIRTALVALVVYGANDYYMFGSNWAGATLRNDWMVYLGLGACALRAQHYKWGGALLAMSALIRAFPAVALLALVLPVLYGVWSSYRSTKKLPTPKEFLAEYKWFVDAAIGAAVCVAGWVLLSSIVLGFDAWPLWVKKISSFTSSPHVNHISLLTVVAGSEGNQAVVLRERMPLFALLTVAYVALAVWAAKNRPPYVAALLGIVMMPVFMYPANYYMHFVFLLPLLVSEPLAETNRFKRETNGRVWALLLGMCAALYFTVKEQALDIHFYNASVILMTTLLALLVLLLPRDEQGIVVPPWVK